MILGNDSVTQVASSLKIEVERPKAKLPFYQEAAGSFVVKLGVYAGFLGSQPFFEGKFFASEKTDNAWRSADHIAT